MLPWFSDKCSIVYCKKNVLLAKPIVITTKTFTEG